MAGKHRMYGAWAGMVNRCHNPNNSGYRYYGGRGIFVCDRWRVGDDGKSGFECWLSDMGERPDRMSLDRIDPDGPYVPGNCRWATRTEQRLNLSEEGWARHRKAVGEASVRQWEIKRASGFVRKSHCAKGHEFTPENSYIREKTNGRYCRECGRLEAERKRRNHGVPARYLKRNHAHPDYQREAADNIVRKG